MRPVDMWMGTSLQSEDTIRGHKFYQSHRAVGTEWLWEAIAPPHILAGIWAKPSHSKGLGLIVAPPPTRIFKHSYGPAMVHSALPRNGDDVYHNETNDFTESHLLC